jgi:HEAT repeat protein
LDRQVTFLQRLVRRDGSQEVKMKKWSVIVVMLLLLAGVAAVLEPTGVLRGLLRSERFYQGRPTNYWERVLLDKAPGRSTNAVQQLADGGADAVPVVLEIWQRHRPGDGSDAELRLDAAQILGQIGPDAATALTALTDGLTDPDPQVRATAALALSKIGVGARRDEVVSCLAKMLDRPEDRLSALKGFFQLRDKAKGAIPQIAEVMLKGQDGDVRWHAAEALAKMGAAAQPALSQLIVALKDEDARVRSHAAEALWKIGPEAAEALPTLRPLVNDPDPEVRRESQRAVKAIEGK